MYPAGGRGPEMGYSTDWSLTHLASRAASGAGLIMVEGILSFGAARLGERNDFWRIVADMRGPDLSYGTDVFVPLRQGYANPPDAHMATGHKP